MGYRIGDTVVYPHHGAAVIEKTEQRELSGRQCEYLVLRLICGDLTVLVPSDACETVGIRDVVSPQEVQRVLDVLRSPVTGTPANWSRRYKAHHQKLRSGDIYQVAEVVRNLKRQQEAKGLSAGEKRMLGQARQILLSELSAAIDGDEEAAEELVDDTLADVSVS